MIPYDIFILKIKTYREEDLPDMFLFSVPFDKKYAKQEKLRSFYINSEPLTFNTSYEIYLKSSETILK